MPLIKRSRKPKGEFNIGPSMNDHGHWFYVIEYGGRWTCHTCSAQFSQFPYGHKCPKDKNPTPRIPKAIRYNGELIGGSLFKPESKLVRRKP